MLLLYGPQIGMYYLYTILLLSLEYINLIELDIAICHVFYSCGIAKLGC